MGRLALIVLFGAVVSACGRGCSAPDPRASSDVMPVAVMNFDDVTDKVWDVVSDGQTGIGVPVHVDKEFLRKTHRRALEKCLHPERDNLMTRLGTHSYRLASTIDIGPGDRFEMHLGGSYDNQPLPKPFVELRARIESCMESEYRASDLYQQTRGGTVHISFTACNLSAGAGE